MATASIDSKEKEKINSEVISVEKKLKLVRNSESNAEDLGVNEFPINNAANYVTGKIHHP